jgi:hypothetical protein
VDTSKIVGDRGELGKRVWMERGELINILVKAYHMEKDYVSRLSLDDLNTVLNKKKVEEAKALEFRKKLEIDKEAAIGNIMKGFRVVSSAFVEFPDRKFPAGEITFQMRVQHILDREK